MWKEGKNQSGSPATPDLHSIVTACLKLKGYWNVTMGDRGDVPGPLNSPGVVPVTMSTNVLASKAATLSREKGIVPPTLSRILNLTTGPSQDRFSFREIQISQNVPSNITCLDVITGQHCRREPDLWKEGKNQSGSPATPDLHSIVTACLKLKGYWNVTMGDRGDVPGPLNSPGVVQGKDGGIRRKDEHIGG